MCVFIVRTPSPPNIYTFCIKLFAYTWLPLPHNRTLIVLLNRYFGGVGADVEIVTTGINYFNYQANLANVKDQLSGLETKSPYIQVKRQIIFFFV